MRLSAGQLTETVTLTLPGSSVSDGRGGFRPGVTPGATSQRSARVRVLQAAERTRLGLPVSSQAWQVWVRATHPLSEDAWQQAHRGRLQWRTEEAAVVSVEPDERRECLVLTVSNQLS